MKSKYHNVKNVISKSNGRKREGERMRERNEKGENIITLRIASLNSLMWFERFPIFSIKFLKQKDK